MHLLLWTTRGQGRIIYDGLQRGLGPHNALFLPAGTLFSLDMGTQCFGQAVQINPDAQLGFPDEVHHLRVRDVHDQGDLSGQIDNLQREYTSGLAFHDEALRAQAGLISVWLRRQIIDTPPPGKRKPAAERLVAAFCALVVRDFCTGAPMSDYAKALGVTPTHLTRSCRQCCGLSAAEILTQRSLHEARRLIVETNLPLKVIGQMLGFGSAAYFSRFVQQHTGQPPSALRNPLRVGSAQPTTVR